MAPDPVMLMTSELLWGAFTIRTPNAVSDPVPLKEKPSAYFGRQCFISCDPDERTVPALMELYGEDRFFWASDFPHPDHTGDYIAELEELAGSVAEPGRRKLLGDNVRRAYGIQ